MFYIPQKNGIMFVTNTTIPHMLQTLEYKEIESKHQCGT
jgi:hypothetical protein